MCDEKRKRSPNWLPIEKILLLELVEKHLKVVENKKTDSVSIRAKLAEWQIMSVEYNSRTTHCHREAENLKSQWESMKKAAKKEASRIRMRRIQTGGGPPDPKKKDSIYSRILSLIKRSAVELSIPFNKDSGGSVQVDSETVTATASDSEYLSGSCNIDIKKNFDINQPLPVSEEDINIDSPTSVEFEIMDLGDYSPDLLLRTSVPNKSCETQAHKPVRKDWGDYKSQLLKTSVSAQSNIVNKNKTGISRRKALQALAKTSIKSIKNSFRTTCMIGANV